jgi:ribosomal protein L30/L7E
MPDKNAVQKMLNKIKAFLDSDYREQIERKEKIIEVLKSLKHRTKAIERQLESIEKNEDKIEDKPALLDELELIKAQRLKAIKVIKGIKEEQ